MIIYTFKGYDGDNVIIRHQNVMPNCEGVHPLYTDHPLVLCDDDFYRIGKIEEVK